jgi:peroxiredoxin Q/BCP
VCAFRDESKQLEKKGVEVVGVSGDSAKTMELFKKENELKYTLLSDEDGAVAKKFGVPVGKGGEIEAKVGGEKVKIKRGVTASRWTFVIGKDGKVIFKDDAVKSKDAATTVLKALDKAEKEE